MAKGLSSPIKSLTYARMTRLQYFRERSTTTFAGGKKSYHIPSRPRVHLPWQTAWDLLGYDREVGHYHHVLRAFLFARYGDDDFAKPIAGTINWNLVYDDSVPTGDRGFLLPENWVEYEPQLRRMLLAYESMRDPSARFGTLLI